MKGETLTDTTRRRRVKAKIAFAAVHSSALSPHNGVSEGGVSSLTLNFAAFVSLCHNLNII